MLLVTTFRTHFCRKEIGGIKSWVLLLTKMELEELDFPFHFAQWTTGSTWLWPLRKRKHKVSATVIPAYCVEVVSRTQHVKGEPTLSPETLLSWKRQSLRGRRWLQSVGQNTSKVGAAQREIRSSAVSPQSEPGERPLLNSEQNFPVLPQGCGQSVFPWARVERSPNPGPWAAESSKGHCFPSGAQSSFQRNKQIPCNLNIYQGKKLNPMLFKRMKKDKLFIISNIQSK